MAPSKDALLGGGRLPACSAAMPVHAAAPHPVIPSPCLAAARREEGGLFRFSLPLQDLVGVDMQPEV